MYSNALKQFRYFNLECLEDNEDNNKIVTSAFKKH